ncbi:hypothetical protein Plhal304r1_c057g0142501 [Plasmopara halstedii]
MISGIVALTVFAAVILRRRIELLLHPKIPPSNLISRLAWASARHCRHKLFIFKASISIP